MTQDTPTTPTRPHTEDTHHILPALADRAYPIDELLPHPKNARRRNKRAEFELRKSLEINGQYRAVIARQLPDGGVQLLAGHGTVEQARALGWTHVAVDIHAGVTDQAAARMVAVDNRTSDLAEYDDAQLLELLRDAGDDLAGTGYDEADVADLVATLDAAAGPVRLTDPDAAPERPAEPLSRDGDVWRLGPHRLVCGDGTDPDVVAVALDGREADIYLTDPPYNVDYTGGTADELTIENDAMHAGDFEQLLLGLFAAAIAHVKPGRPAYVFHADTAGLTFRQTFTDTGWLLKQVLVWVKDALVLGRQDHHWQHEPILYGWRPGAAHTWYGGRALTTVFDEQPDFTSMTKEGLVEVLEQLFAETTVLRHPRPRRASIHPTMKPVGLLERILDRSTRRGDTALDTCAGSGSTAIACHGTNRKAALVELDPRYVDVICLRWQQHTGDLPIRDATGETVDFTRSQVA